ncbi:hypothetical protein J1N35_021191 [Gossypium stocksii]|uniref:Uncharacterized protein n=1 Tax=Gossypium stocksii TaxID=47602 RepID=A0A9D4A1Q8_9ROSI|nr:hypothetical protein J1N35_021191 [Gossypium stocksii]
MSVPTISKKNGEKRVFELTHSNMAYWALTVRFARYMPHLSMVSAQISYTIPTSLCSEGLNSHLYVTYRFIIADLVMSPFAYFLERRVQNIPHHEICHFPSLFIVKLISFFLSSRKSRPKMTRALRYTSPTFVASVVNTVSSLTFVTAIVLSLWSAPLHLKRLSSIHENWVKGSILTVASCISLALWYIMQVIAF